MIIQQFLMVIAKEIRDEKTGFVDLLLTLRAMSFIVLLVLPQDLAPEHGPVPDVHAPWFWERLLDGEQTMPWRDLRKLVGLGNRGKGKPKEREAS